MDTITLSDGGECYPLIDLHRQHVCYVRDSEAKNLVRNGYAVLYGSRKRTHGLRLIVPLSKLTGSGQPEKALTVASANGTRFVFKQKVRTANGETHTVFRHKSLHPTESPNWALRRIMKPPALEAQIHIFRRECSREELQQHDAGGRGQKALREIFRISPGSATFRARSASPASV